MFDQFWKTYPARNGKKVGKSLCLTYFSRYDEPTRKLVVLAAQHYATACKPNGHEFVPLPRDPIRFIKGDWWREWIEEAAQPCRFRSVTPCDQMALPGEEVCATHKAYREKLIQMRQRVLHS